MGDLIAALRQLTDAVRQLPSVPQAAMQSHEVPATSRSADPAARDEVEASLRRLQALERCHAAFGRAPTEDVAELPPIRRLYAQRLRVLHDRPRGLAGTPVEGYIAEDASRHAVLVQSPRTLVRRDLWS